MDKLIIEITETKRHLCVNRGFLVVMEKEKELAKIPVDSVGVVLANSHGLTMTNNFLVKLAQNNIPLVVCGKNHQPESVMWPVSGNYRHSACTDAQIEKAGINKRVWKDIVINKIKCQRAVLNNLGDKNEQMKTLETTVKSGDPENNEAQAARIYWTKLFGKDFRRDRDEEGINFLLNYGYTILRSLTSRAVMSYGLNPVLGVHHRNKLNPFRLVDDIMEPFRPMVDQLVYTISKNYGVEVDKRSKRILAGVHLLPLLSGGVQSTLGNSVGNLCSSLAKLYLGETENLVFPDGILKDKHVNEHIMDDDDE